MIFIINAQCRVVADTKEEALERVKPLLAFMRQMDGMEVPEGNPEVRIRNGKVEYYWPDVDN